MKLFALKMVQRIWYLARRPHLCEEMESFLHRFLLQDQHRMLGTVLRPQSQAQCRHLSHPALGYVGKTHSKVYTGRL